MATHRAASRRTASAPAARGAAATLAVGVPLLRAALLAPRGSTAFRRRTSALAATWTAGGLAGGALDPARWRVSDGDELRERVLVPLVTAAGAVGVFAAGASVVVRVPLLLEEVETVLAHATRGSYAQATALALLTGAAEELFFRGTVHDVVTELGLPAVPTTAATYATTIGAAGNPLLVLAAGILGVLTGRERERTDSLLAPTLVHVGWSLGMVTILPRITRGERARMARRRPRGGRR